MPNTLCHIAAQLPVSRLFAPAADVRLVLIACVIPDIPWIIRRVLAAAPFIDGYQVQGYAIGQSAFFCCCFLALAIALLAERVLFSFLLIAGNCLAHLLLDACQIKWANGVHILAPFSWRPWRFDFSWPDHLLWFILSGLGLAVLLWAWRDSLRKPWPFLVFGRGPRFFLAAFCLILYIVAPLAFLGPIAREDNGFLATLHEQSARPGKYVEFDRKPFAPDLNHRGQAGFLTLFGGERLRLRGVVPEDATLLSARGRFIDRHTVAVLAPRRQSAFRDLASMVALALVALLFIHSFVHSLSRRKQPDSGAPETSSRRTV